MQDQDFYSIKEMAKKLNVCPDTIRRAIRTGSLSAFRISGSKKSAFRIAHSEIARMGVVNLKKVIKGLIETGEWKNI